MTRSLRLGFSPCPNDIFAYCGLLEGQVDRRGLSIELEVQDVEQLNQGLLEGRLDVAKASFAAVMHEPRRWMVLPVGAALGFGVGPLLVASRHPRARRGPAVVVAPGAHTTATLLYRLFEAEVLGEQAELRQAAFSEVFPALERGDADYGVCIHEGRFTYQDHGLICIADLGERWEQASGLPLPLGGMVARRTLETDLLARTCSVLRASLRWGHAHPSRAMEAMRAHAQELDGPTIRAHVRTYVSAATDDFGVDGARALAGLRRRACDSGLSAATEDLPIFFPPAGTYPPRLFHVLNARHQEALASEVYLPSSLSREGFLHLSQAEQLPATLDRHFRAESDLLLIEVGLGVEAEEPLLRMEASAQGATYPHLYRPLGRGEILRGWKLARHGSERGLPQLGESCSGDSPQGISLDLLVPRP